jgi:hypothetical protein
MAFPDYRDTGEEYVSNLVGLQSSAQAFIESMDDLIVYDKESAMKIINEILAPGFEPLEGLFSMYKRAIGFIIPCAKLNEATINTIIELAKEIKQTEVLPEPNAEPV